jgi:hypothetical protein
MYSLILFPLSYALFFFAVQQPYGPLRILLSVSYMISMIGCLTDKLCFPDAGSFLSVEFIVWATLYTSSVLFIKRSVVPMEELLSLSGRLRAVTRLWINIRNINLLDDKIHVPYSHNRFKFAISRLSWTLCLVSAYTVTSRLVTASLTALETDISDFGLASQGFLPPFNTKAICLRAIFSVRWVWNTYIILVTSHSMLSIIFVSILAWDSPKEWPPLFGKVGEAYTLRRFWGAFWHRLHITSFELVMPHCLKRQNPNIAGLAQNEVSLRQPEDRAILHLGFGKKALRALWIFFLSALCHTFINVLTFGTGYTISELRFFLSNFCICFMETMVELSLLKRGRLLTSRNRFTTVFGYLWVLAVFFCLCPNWQYPLIYSLVG